MKTTVDDFLKLPYSTVTIRNDDGSYFIRVLELPGCMSEGESIEEAYEMIEDAKRAWLESAIDRGLDIPQPECDQREPSGKLLLRMPISLHKKLAQTAKKDKVSLNNHIVTLLAEKNARVEDFSFAMNELVSNLVFNFVRASDYIMKTQIDSPPYWRETGKILQYRQSV